MNTIDKIRAEIERRMVELAKDKYIDLHDASCRTKELNLLLSFLDTLEGHSEKPNNHEGLDEAAENYVTDWSKISAYEIEQAFKAGAEWQKDKDTRDMYMSDNRHFQKVYELGRKEEMEQMMKEAVEGEVVKDISNKLAVTAKINLDEYKFGDKVRIIIVKEDEK